MIKQYSAYRTYVQKIHAAARLLFIFSNNQTSPTRSSGSEKAITSPPQLLPVGLVVVGCRKAKEKTLVHKMKMLKYKR